MIEMIQLVFGSRIFIPHFETQKFGIECDFDFNHSRDVEFSLEEDLKKRFKYYDIQKV